MMTKTELEKQLENRWCDGKRGASIRCDGGWFSIISKLDSEIQKLAPDYVILTIKEKFGSLRYYIGEVDESVFEKIHQLIFEAEKASADTCECCGEPGKLSRLAGWLKTLCKNCFVDWVEFESRPSEYGVTLTSYGVEFNTPVLENDETSS